MKLFKRFFLTGIIICSVTSLSGCVYSNNKNWDDMTSEEKQEVKENFEEVKEELEEDFSDNDVADEFALYIIDKVEQSIDNAK